VTFEGIEGSGKSSLVKRLAAALERPDRPVVATREPGEGLDPEIREYVLNRARLEPLSEAFYMLMDRHQHVVGRIRPLLERGTHVLCDRYIDSTVAYQGGGSGIDRAALRAMNDLAVGATRPDLTILLDLAVPAALERVRARSQHKQLDRFESETLEFHQRVRRAYLEPAAAEPGRFVVIDAARPTDAVVADVLPRLEALLSPVA
jgi:dTMP kinase